MPDSYLIEILLSARDEASAKIRALQRQVEELRASAAGGNAATDLSKAFDDMGDSAGDAADEVARHNAEQERLRRVAPQHTRVIRDTAAAHSEAAKAVEDHTGAQSDQLDQVQRGEQGFKDQAVAMDDAGKAAQRLEQRIREVQAAESDLNTRYRGNNSAAREYADGLSLVQRAYTELSKAAPLGSSRSDDMLKEARRLKSQTSLLGTQSVGNDTTAAYRDFTKAVKDGDVSTAAARRGFQGFSSDFKKLSLDTRLGGDAMRDFSRLADDAGKNLKNINLAQASNDFTSFVARISQLGDGVLPKIQSISAALRGFRLVAIVGFLQQLDTAVVGLAGSLVAVAADAVQAGAALGGALVSGLAQAVPVAAIFLAGVERIKSILQAVALSQQQSQQASFDPTQAAATQLATAQGLIAAQNALVDANDNVVTSQQRLVESQQALTDARTAAIRNIQDLTLAEKTASEEATGARLSLAQAEQALQQLEQTGGSQLQLQQAQLAVTEARTGVTSANLAVPRARADAARARQRGVNTSTSVMDATTAERQALLAAQRAPQQVQAAQEALQQAQMKAASPSGSETSTQGQLNYLLSQMSGPERALYTSLNKLETELKQPGGPLAKIRDAIVTPFADAIGHIQVLLNNPAFMGSMNRLADAVKKGLGQVLAPKGATGFFETMANDATKNAPIIANIISSIESLFMSIATAAAPALHMLLEDFSRFIQLASFKDASPEGQKKITTFFDDAAVKLEHIVGAFHAFYDLLKALGSDAAPAGDSVFTSLTKSMEDATKWVNTHGPEVRKFFADAVSVLAVIGGMLLSLGKIMIAVFDSGAMKTFGLFIDQFLLPAIGDVARVLGFLMTGFLNLINLFGGPGRTAVELLTAAFVGMLVLNKVADAFLGATRGAQALWEAIKVFKAGGTFTEAMGAFSTSMTGVGNAGKAAAPEVEALGTTTATAGTEAKAASVEMDTASGAELLLGENALTATPEVAGLSTAELGLGAGAAGVGIGVAGAAGAEALGAAAGLGGDQGPNAIPSYALHPPGQNSVPAPTTGQTLKQFLAKNFGLPPGYKGGPITAASYKGAGIDTKAVNTLFAWLKTLPGGFTGKGGAFEYKADTREAMPTGTSTTSSQLVSYLEKQGFTAAAATGVAGNVEQESGFSSTAGTPATHYGLAQWSPSRQAGLETLAKQLRLPVNSVGVQEAYIAQELQTGAYSSVGAQINAPGVTPMQAATILSNQYEVPDTPGTPAAIAEALHRAANAQKIAGGTVAGTVGGATSAVLTSAATKPAATQPAISQLSASISKTFTTASSQVLNIVKLAAQAHAAALEIAQATKYLGVNPSNTISLLSTFFTDVKNGFTALGSASEKSKPLTKQITDFANYASNAMTNFTNVIANNVTQLQTRLTDIGETAGFSVGPGGMVSSTGVTAGDPAIVSGAEQSTQAMQGEKSFLTSMISRINQKIKQTKLVKDKDKRKTELAQLYTQYASYQNQLTQVGDAMATNIETTYQDEQQAVQDELTSISNQYGVQQSGLTTQQSNAQTLGNFAALPALDLALASSATNQVAALKDALLKANAMGDATTAAQIQEQIDQLDSSIVQYTAQSIADAVSAIQGNAATASSRTSLLSSLAGVATTQGKFGLAGALSASSYQNAIASDQTQISQYQPLLAAANAAGNVGQAQTIQQTLDQLAADLATNTQALTDNTTATDDVTASYVQARGQFTSGVYGNIVSVIQTLGQITGNVDLPALRQAYQGSNNSLNTANAGLSSTLNSDFGVNVQGLSPGDLIAKLSGLDMTGMEAGMDPAQVTEFENLINGLITNTQAITTNNLQLATLNGQLAQPQSFTSTAFSSFRDAIFTGMGGLNPTYASALGVMNPTNPGLSGTGAPGQVSSTMEQNIHVYPNPALPGVDPSTMGQQIAFAMKTPSR